MRRPNLVVFARAPRLGAVKRRLAAGIGALAALRFYRLTVHRTLRRLARDHRWTVQVALTPDTVPWPRDWPRLPRMAQGRGDIGRRMASVLRRLEPGPTIIVGSDIPELDAGDLARAVTILKGQSLVFGPATDGGYWLVGSRGRVPRNLFRHVRWSTPHALADTLRNCQGRRMLKADTLDDVDDADAYRRWLARHQERKSVRSCRRAVGSAASHAGPLGGV